MLLVCVACVQHNKGPSKPIWFSSRLLSNNNNDNREQQQRTKVLEQSRWAFAVFRHLNEISINSSGHLNRWLDEHFGWNEFTGCGCVCVWYWSTHRNKNALLTLDYDLYVKRERVEWIVGKMVRWYIAIDMNEIQLLACLAMASHIHHQRHMCECVAREQTNNINK